MAVTHSEMTDFQVRDILFTWEKRRILYNLIHLPMGLILLVIAYQDFKTEMHPLEILGGAVAMGVGMNMCYFVAPVSEVYSLVFLKFAWRGWLRNVVFWTGTVFSTIFMQSVVIASMLAIQFSNN